MEPQTIIMNDKKVLLSSAKNQQENQKFYTGISWYSSFYPNQNKSSFYRRQLFSENTIGHCQIPVGWTPGGKITLGGGRECATIIKSLGRKNRSLNLNGRMLKKWCQVKAFSIFVCESECKVLEICDSGTEWVFSVSYTSTAFDFRMVPEVTKKFDKFFGSLIILQKAKTDILLDLHFTDERQAEIVLRNC